MAHSNLKITVAFAILWPLGVLGGGAGAQPPPRAEDFFKWGEYDSLIAVLAPWAASLPGKSSGADSAAARDLVRLGVAYYATGRAGRADSLFLRGFRLGGDIKADSFYVSEEIAARFELVTGSERKRESSTAVTPGPVFPERGATPLPEVPSVYHAGKTWLAWGGGAVAALAAVGGVYYLKAQAPAHKTTETIVNVK